MSMSTYYIYKITNINNHKSYIGCTKDIGARIRQHIKTSSDRDNELHIAIDDCGIKNFTFQIIEISDNKYDGHYLESKYIREYNTIIPNGYNMAYSDGGNPKTKPIVCLSKEGKFIKKYDYLSQTQKDGYDIHSVTASLRSPSRTAMGNMFMYLDDYEKNGAKKYKNPSDNIGKPIIQCDLSGNYIKKFSSVSKAADELKLCRSNISANLIMSSKSCGGYIFVYENDFPIKDISVYKTRVKGKKVVQLDKDTLEKINVFENMSDAGRFLGKTGGHKNILKVINNIEKSSYGYRWMYLEDYELQYANTEVINQIAKG